MTGCHSQDNGTRTSGRYLSPGSQTLQGNFIVGRLKYFFFTHDVLIFFVDL